MSFSTVPTRKNSGTIDASWWNALQAAGEALEELVAGPMVIPETSVDIANNQLAAANVTGLVLDSTKTRGAMVTAEVRRKTDAGEKIALRRFALIYSTSAATWSLDPGERMGADDGVTLSVVAGTGQVQYVSDDLAGANYTGKMRFKVTTFGV